MNRLTPEQRFQIVQFYFENNGRACDFHKRILFSDEVHFWLNGYVIKQNGRIWSEANPQVYVETPLHPENCLFGALYRLVESLVRTSSKTMKATTLQSMVIGIEP
ncbi:tc3a_0 protein [Trichonephila clavipes]|nr:tc3a_0 protein [Trichonephila clavipes]